jgi:cell division protein FtsA
MSRHTLSEVVEPRMREIFEQAMNEICRSGLQEQIAAGIVLTGGTAKMQAAVDVAEEIFQMPVRIGQPVGITGLTDYVNDPSFSTSVGLLQYGRTMQHSQSNRSTDASNGNWLSRLTKWFQGEF